MDEVRYRLAQSRDELEGGQVVLRLMLQAFRGEDRCPESDIVSEKTFSAVDLDDPLNRILALGAVATDLAPALLYLAEVVHEKCCRECGCTEARACVLDELPCAWVDSDFCSSCLTQQLNRSRLADGLESFRHEQVLENEGKVSPDRIPSMRVAGMLPSQRVPRPSC